MRDFFLYLFVFIVFNIIIFIAVRTGTSPEYWYVGMHDDKCETTLYDEKECHCYERLVAADKEKNKNNK